MTEDCKALPTNRMLGSQLVNKSIIRCSPTSSSSSSSLQASAKQQPAKQKEPARAMKENDHDKSPTRISSSKIKTPPTTPTSKPHQQPTQIPKSKKSPELKQSKLVVATSDNDEQQQVAGSSAASDSSAKELQLLLKESQDLKARTRKLQLEVDEKNEIINVLKDELETLREQNDKYHRDSIQLIKDSKRVKFLQDENDFLQDRVGQVEILELEIKRLKERLNETDFFKLRVSELEEDLSKSREESNQFEDKWRQTESKLSRVAELEVELNKWKSFSHELELEKNSIQSKLLESIDHETKLGSDNKKVEDEVRRLRDLIKSYEEQRDEEQASNSLIMSVADLKQLDSQHQQQMLMETGTNTESFSVQDTAQQTETSDTAEKSCETDQINLKELEEQRQNDNNQLKALMSENESLKGELEAQEGKLNDLTLSNKQIFSEIDGNKRLISDLRQDLACEKSLTQKLTTQLTSFTKQIKSLDKQYFPMHDAKATTDAPTQKKQIDLDQRSADQSKLASNADWKSKSAFATPPSAVTHVKEEAPKNLSEIVTSASQKTSSNVHQMNGLQAGSPSPIDESNHQKQLAKKKITMPRTSANATPDGSKTANEKPQPTSNGIVVEQDEEDEGLDETRLVRAPTPVKSYRSSEQRDNKSSNFVRNSMPSRSVNFGHSKTSSQLERIRASVTATTTTSSTNATAASFNEQTGHNNILGPSDSQVIGGNVVQNPGFVLNCMLNHHHSERCFARIERPTRVQVSQLAPPNVMLTNPSLHQNQHQQITNQQIQHSQIHHRATANATGVSPSRQLNALIDPVANEQLLMNVLQQQLIAQQQSGLPSANQLTEQQVAHLNNLQRQHYYHHLHQLHQIHHLHQLHHLHHKCQQRQQQQQQQQHQSHKQPMPEHPHKHDSNAPDLNANVVGSQFYAPNYDQVYANMVSNNDKQKAEHNVQRQDGTRLVNNESDHKANVSQQQDYKRTSPQRPMPASAVYLHQMGGTKLAQIDELANGMPTSYDLNVKKTHVQLSKPVPSNQSLSTNHQTKSNKSSNGASSQQRQQQISPTLSSPTSSRTSSNISPSSEVSSSSSTSSTNSLSTSVPLTRSALRHTSTDLSRRQYSVERELINSTPLTAKLSRVGSCRGAPDDRLHLLGQPETTTSKDMLRNPVQSQSQQMRTSKILNIGSQQQDNAISTGNVTANHPPALCKETKTSNGAHNFDRTMTNGMASIKLNDNLAFASLRVPKKSSSGSNLNSSLIATAAAAKTGRSMNSRVSSASSSPDKARMMKAVNTNLASGKPGTTGSTTNNNGHSSVWYEYGCI